MKIFVSLISLVSVLPLAGCATYSQPWSGDVYRPSTTIYTSSEYERYDDFYDRKKRKRHYNHDHDHDHDHDHHRGRGRDDAKMTKKAEKVKQEIKKVFQKLPKK